MLILKKHITLIYFTGILLVSFACKKKNQEVTNNVPGNQVEEPFSYEFKSIYFVSEESSNLEIYNYDLSSLSLEKSISSDFGGIFTDPQNQQITISGLEDDLVTYNSDFIEEWRVSAMATPFPFFHHFEKGPGEKFNLFVSNENAEVRSYASNGATNDLIQIVEANMFPYAFGSVSSGYTFIDVKDYSKSNEELFVYYTSTGQFWFKNNFTNRELIGVGDLGSGSNEALLFINDGGIGKVLRSNVDTQVSNEYRDLGTEIVDVVGLNATEFIVATKDFGIGLYDYSNNTFSAFNTSINNAQLLINKEDNRVIAVSGSSIYFLDDFGAIAGSYSHTSQILGADLMYK